MTCIAGVVNKGRVVIGGDSAGVQGDSLSLRVRSDKKVFLNKGYALGFTSSFRMGQLLEYAFVPPVPKPKQDLMQFMAVDFVDAVRQCLKSGGFASKTNETESGGTFLVGYQGRLFTIESDYQVAEHVDGVATVGCGQSYALGALLATSKVEARKRVLNALKIAEQCSAGVRGPFHIVTTK
jgi:ATP-dependent protease HslVU (ClpYQ) peptidase subunit